MSKQVIYIFIYKDEIFKYSQIIKFSKGLSRHDTYKYLDKVAQYGLNMFLRDKNITDDFKIDFIVWHDAFPYYMYACRTALDIDYYIFRLEPIITIMEKNKFTYNDIVIVNTCRCNDFIVGDNITEFKIIDDGINKFDESHINLLDNLPFSVERVYLLYDVKKTC